MSDGDWLSTLADRAGPLGAAAARFLAERDVAFARVPPRGREALAFLARALDAYCEVESPTDEEDRRFVEGAGALLALVLVDELGGRGHEEPTPGVHRVQIGARGYFDPFGAIERALDDDAPRAALAREIRQAEAEARGEGPSSRVVTRFEAALERARPELRVSEAFERYVRLGDGVEVDLGRVIDATRGEELGAVDRAVEKLVSMLPGADGTSRASWDELAPRLVPRLVGRAFVTGLEERGQEAAALLLFPFAHDVSIAVLVEHDGRARYLRSDEVKGFDRAPEDVLARAVQNLGTLSSNARFARIETEAGPIVVARTGDGRDAARLLLPTLHEVLSTELGELFLVAVPHRDTLLACSPEPPALVTLLAARARDDAARAPHAVTAELFEVDAGGVGPFFSDARARGTSRVD